MRILAIDFGEKHIGTALADTGHSVALKHEDIEVSSRHEALEKVGAMVRAEHIDRVVFGLPLTFHFEETPLCGVIRALANALTEATGVQVAFKNEVLTSDLSKRLTQSDKDHGVSAQILLQEYMDAMSGRHQG